jgi:hypothetical protein
MKALFSIILAASTITLIIIVIKLFDLYTTLKYEIEEPIAMNKISNHIQEKSGYVCILIKWLWVTLGYIIITIVLTTRAIFK